jgi:hypothetical protein
MTQEQNEVQQRDRLCKGREALENICILISETQYPLERLYYHSERHSAVYRDRFSSGKQTVI